MRSMNRRLEITRVESADTYGQLNQKDLFAVEAKTYCLDPTINLTTFELLHSYLCFLNYLNILVCSNLLYVAFETCE